MADPNGQGPVCKSGMRGFDSLPPLRRYVRLTEVAPEARSDGHRSSKPAFAGSNPVGGAMPAKLKRTSAWLRTRRVGVRVSPRVPRRRQVSFRPRSSMEERRSPKPGFVKVRLLPGTPRVAAGRVLVSQPGFIRRSAASSILAPATRRPKVGRASHKGDGGGSIPLGGTKMRG